MINASDLQPVLVASAAADPTTVIVAWVGAILGTVSLLLTIVFQALKIIAPLTKTRIDDEIRDGIGEILDHVRSQRASATVLVARAPQIGRARLLVQCGLALSGLALLVAAILACGARQRIAAGAGAFLDCEAPHVDAQMLADAKVITTSAVEKWISGAGTIDTEGLRADAVPLKTDLMRCAMDAAIAALLTPTPVQPGGPAAAPMTVDAAQIRLAWRSVRSELGWPAQAVP